MVLNFILLYYPNLNGHVSSKQMKHFYKNANTIITILFETTFRHVSNHCLFQRLQFVLELLDEALQLTPHGEEFEVSILAFQLGQHDTSDEIIVEAFDVKKATISIHAAITISSNFFDRHLVWSRFGLQEIVGERGTFTTALTLSSCANFQTNLDGRLIDITPELRQICKTPHFLNCIQFYADTPHMSSSHTVI